ncbi:MAG: glycerol-3-phosphate 1-O-acyltransferase [Myxococcota bacterium]
MSLDSRSRVFLVDGDGLERHLIREWIGKELGGAAHEIVRIPPTRAWDAGRLDATLVERLARADAEVLTPVRVAWLPRELKGERAVRLFDLLTLGNPRAPGYLTKRWVLARHPDRVRVVAGEPATAAELRRRFKLGFGAGPDEPEAFALYVLRQAALTLERAERSIRGARYKVPRFVREEVLSHRDFRAGVASLTKSTGLDEKRVRRRAEYYLREIAARVSPYVIDLVHRLIRLVYRQGYAEDIAYDREKLKALLAPKPGQTVVFLPTHKSNLDHAILQYVLYDNGAPPNHTAGGINMNFFPVGPVFRRTGVFFIRRTFKDNPIYKFVLRQYVDFLVEKRFSLEWYIEGGRSRSGKLLPPRFGMLAYVVDAWRRGRADDVLLVPVSIAYDQISDVGDYAHEARGGAKEKEGLGWFVKMLKGLKRSYGQIHLNFGEPVSLKASLGKPDASAATGDPEEKNLTVQKLAFEVCHRINQATPITPNAALSLALLGAGERAVTVDELLQALSNTVRYARLRKLPATTPLDDLETKEGLTRHLQGLAANGVVRCFDEGPEPVWALVPNQFLTAAYYRNTVLHFFVNGSIAELALLHAATAAGDKRQAFDEEAMRLRDLLKFEFFFAEKDAFRKALADEVAFHVPDWESAFPRGEDAVEDVVRRFRPFSSHRVLRPFVDAYRIVADALLREDGAVEEGPFVGKCLALGRQYVLQKRVHSEESVSKVLFATALKLAGSRGCLTGDGLVGKRRAFAEQLKDVVRRLDAVESLAASRRAGLIE